MERRDRSLKALEDLKYIDSLDPDDRAKQLALWVNKNLQNSSIENFDLPLPQLQQLSELFYKNITFLKTYKDNLKEQLDSNQKIKKFLN